MPRVIYRTFYPTYADYTVLSSAEKILSRKDHMIDHISNLSKLRKT